MLTHAIKRAAKCVALVAVLLLAACGGGGGDSGTPSPPPSPADLSVSSQSLTSNVGIDDAASTAAIHATVSNPGGSAYTFASGTTNSGIASVTNPANGSAGDFVVQFKDPKTLGVGVYTDTVTIKACSDSSCQQPIKDSPISVKVTYTVLDRSHISNLGPSAVVSGGPGFLLLVTGTRFDSTSTVMINGHASSSTSLNSPNSLTAVVSANDIAVAGNVQVTVQTAGVLSNVVNLTVSKDSVPATIMEPVLSLNATSDTSLGGGPELQHAFSIAVNGPTNATYYYMLSYTGSAVAGLDLGGNGVVKAGTTIPPGPSTGRITGEPNGGLGGTVTGSFTGPVLSGIGVYLQNASVMGAGTYTDLITVEVCTDAQCTHPIGGAQTIAVTYVVSGNPIPVTQFMLPVNMVVLESPTSAAAGATSTLTLSSNGLPPYGAYVTTTTAGTAVGAVSFQSNLDGTGTLTITAKPPQTLGSGIYTDSVQVNVCFDLACTKPANHFPQTIQITYVVDASAGVDFVQRAVPGEVEDLKYSPVHDRIYATANSDTGGLRNYLVVINPNTATVESTLYLGDGADPNQLELSDDGQYAYIQGSSQVTRIALDTLTVDLTVRLPLASPLEAIKVAPGQPHTFAIETDDSNYATIRIFDDAVQRPQTYVSSSLEVFLPITFDGDSSTLYAYNPLLAGSSMLQLAVAANGASVAKTTSVTLTDTNLNYMQYVNGLIYTDGGSIFNPTNGSLSTFPLTNSNLCCSGVYGLSAAIDSILSRAYMLTTDTGPGLSTGATIEGFNLTTLKPTWIARFPSSRGRIIRWGANGLAFFDGGVVNPQVILISGNIIAR